MSLHDMNGFKADRLPGLQNDHGFAYSGDTMRASGLPIHIPVGLMGSLWPASGVRPIFYFSDDPNTVNSAARFLFTSDGVLRLCGSTPLLEINGSTPGNRLVEFAQAQISMVSTYTLTWCSSTTSHASSRDTFFGRGDAAATIRFGALSAANPPVAQTLSVQDASGTNIAGAAWTFRESRATGTAKGGGFRWYLGGTAASGTTLQTAALALDLGVTTYKVLTFADAIDIAFNTTTGTKIGTATTQKIGFYNATPIVQGASIADPSGGAIQDAEARTAIIALITRLEALGLIATV